jgi:hypothetical protein
MIINFCNQIHQITNNALTKSKLMESQLGEECKDNEKLKLKKTEKKGRQVRVVKL